MAEKKEPILAQELRQYDNDGVTPTTQFALDPGLNWWTRKLGDKSKWSEWELTGSPRSGAYNIPLVDEHEDKDDSRPLRKDYELPEAKAPEQPGQPKVEEKTAPVDDGTVKTAQETDETQAGVAAADKTGTPVVDPAVFPNAEEAPTGETKKR